MPLSPSCIVHRFVSLVRRSVGFLALSLILADVAFAGTMTAELSQTESELGQSVGLTITAAGQLHSKLELPDVPGLVFRYAGQHNSVSQINGETTVEHTASYIVYPQRAGTYTIPGIRANVDGEEAVTLPLTLTIKPASGQNNAQSGGGAQGSSKAAQEANGGVFIERECSTDAPYVGEQVVCAVRVYHRGNLRGGQRLSENSADFRRFNIEGEKQFQKQINGQRYVVIELREVVVPTKAGTLEVPPFVLDARVAYRQRVAPGFDRFFDQLGSSGFFDMALEDVKSVNVKSPRQVWNVKPLPEAGKPANFSGIVGRFQLTANLSKTQVTAGESVTITIETKGEGILDSLTEIKPSLDAIGRVYADKPTYSEEADGEFGIRSHKIFRYALVPNKAGHYQLGKLQLPVFDPKLGQYLVLETELGQLIVDPGKAEEKSLVVGASPTAPATSPQKNVQMLGQDLLGPHRELTLGRSDQLTRGDVALLATLAGLPLSFGLGCAGLVAWRTRQGQGETRAKRRALAARRALGELEQVRAALGAGAAPALATAHRAFRAYIADKLGLPGTALAANELAAGLETLGVGGDVRTRVLELIERLERVEFGGREPDAHAARGWIDELGQCIKEIDERCSK